MWGGACLGGSGAPVRASTLGERRTGGGRRVEVGRTRFFGRAPLPLHQRRSSPSLSPLASPWWSTGLMVSKGPAWIRSAVRALFVARARAERGAERGACVFLSFARLRATPLSHSFILSQARQGASQLLARARLTYDTVCTRQYPTQSRTERARRRGGANQRGEGERRWRRATLWACSRPPPACRPPWCGPSSTCCAGWRPASFTPWPPSSSKTWSPSGRRAPNRS